MSQIDQTNISAQTGKSPGLGDRLGNYVLEQRLGEGAQAEVYLARDVVLQREVAIKILHSGVADSGEPNLEGLEEARLIATLEHTHIVRVYHVGRSSGVWYMAMEHVGGNSLRRMVGRKGVLEPIEALRCIRDAADALTCVHGLGVVHRDIKPHNLLTTYSGVVKLVDFGLALWDPHNLQSQASPTNKRRVGTPEYLAPEVWRNQGAGVSADIYSLGATLFFLLVGRAPFIGNTIDAQRDGHLNKDPAVPEDLPPVVRSVILSCMAKQSSDRPATARELTIQVDHALKMLTGDRRAPSIPPVWADSACFKEPLAKMCYEDREAANASVLSLSWCANALKRIELAMFSSHPIVVFHGNRTVQSRIVRSMYERRNSELYVVSRVVIASERDSLINALCERLKILPTKTTKVYDAVVSRLSAAVSTNIDIRSVLHVYAPHSLRAADYTALAELATRVRGKELVILVVCGPKDGKAVCHEFDAMGHSDLVASVNMPTMHTDQLEEYVDTWTALATQSHLRWTPDAHRLLFHVYCEQRAPLDHLVHNSLVLTLNAGERLVTTWQVCGSCAHENKIQSAEEILIEWHKRPSIWPNDETRSMMETLRGNADSAKGE